MFFFFFLFRCQILTDALLDRFCVAGRVCVYVCVRVRARVCVCDACACVHARHCT